MGTAGNSFARGLGIKAGEGRLHPSFDLDLVYDSNPGYFSGDAVSDMVLRIRPGITLSFPSPMLSFDMTGKVGYDYYFGIEDKRTSDLSTVAGEADLKLGINPEGQISFFLEDQFSRTGDPQYTSLAGRFDRTDNEAKAHLQYKPGGGALMFDLAYGIFVDWFDESGGLDAGASSSYSHRVYFSGKWKFFPKTALVVDFDTDIRRYPNSYRDGTRNLDLNGIRATVGALGQITPTIAATVKLGYGDTLLVSRTGYTGSNFRSVIGQVEVAYRAGTTFIQGGYLRNFQPVTMFGYFGQDRIYARLKQQLGGRFDLSLGLSYDYLTFGKSMFAGVASAGGRYDNSINGSVGANYLILDWLEVGLSYSIRTLISDWQQPPPADLGVEYTKHLVTFHLGVDY